MFLRISSAALTAMLVHGCAQESAAPEGDLVACAIGPGAEFSEVCTLETAGDGEFLIHQPDGGFRRIIYDAPTDQLGVRDGADSLKMSDASTAQHAEFTIGANRYRIPSDLLRAQKE